MRDGSPEAKVPDAIRMVDLPIPSGALPNFSFREIPSASVDFRGHPSPILRFNSGETGTFLDRGGATVHFFVARRVARGGARFASASRYTKLNPIKAISARYLYAKIRSGKAGKTHHAPPEAGAGGYIAIPAIGKNADCRPVVVTHFRLRGPDRPPQHRPNPSIVAKGRARISR